MPWAATFSFLWGIGIQPCGEQPAILPKKKAGASPQPALRLFDLRLEVHRALVAVQRGFVHVLRKGRVSVADAGQIFGSTAEFHRDNRFGDDFGGIGADDMDAEDAVGLLAGQNLHETGRIAHAQRTAIGQERHLAGLVRDTFGLERLLGLANPGNFRRGVDDPGNGVEVAVTSLASHQLGNHDALFMRLVGQHRATYDVTDSPDARQVGGTMTIDFDEATGIELQANAFGIQAIGVRHTADRDDQAVSIQLLSLAILVFVGDRNALLGCFDIADLDTHLDVQTLLGEQLLGFLGDIDIGRSQEVRHGFKDGYFGTDTTPDRAHFQTDDAGTDDSQLLRHGFLIQGTFVVHDDLLIDRNVRQMTGLGAGSDDDLLGQHFLGADLDLPVVAFLANEGTMASQEGDLVLLQQHLDAAGQLIHDAILACLHGRHVDGCLADLDALRFEAVIGFLKQVRGVQQGFGRDAAHVQAGAAKARLTLRVGIGIGFGTSCRETELRSTDSSNVAAGATANNEHVKLLGHVTTFQNSDVQKRQPPLTGNWRRQTSIRRRAASGTDLPALPSWSPDQGRLRGRR